MAGMSVPSWRRFLIAAVALILLTSLGGCAHRGVEPFVTAPAGLAVERGKPPACFSAPLAECVDGTAPVSPEQRFASRWVYPFHPDLHHRVCRGDAAGRERFLDGARSLGCTEGTGCAWPTYLDFLAGCSSAGFCEWASGVAEDGAEDPATRRLLLEAVRRGCRGVMAKERYDALGADLLDGGRPLGDQPPWTTSSEESRCAALEVVDDPWEDLVARHGAGCLDLDDWVGDHRNDRAGVSSALERCVDRREIRYREADCLRELAGLDRDRAVAFLRADDRRGWGMSSIINRYARTLLRFPVRGELEARMGSLGLLPARSKTPPKPGPVEILPKAVLPEEILEAHGRLLRLSPACSERYCEHAPLLYRLAQLASPELDDLVITERWPLREEVDLGSGSRGVSTTLRGIPVTFRVAAAPAAAPAAADAAADDHGGQDGGTDGVYDPGDFDRLRTAALEALEAPHEITIYDRGRVYRLPVRQLGGWYDLEALLGGLNTVLARRGSPLRATALAPHCIPCAQVVVGPTDGLIEAAFDGLIEVTDPFRELWTHRQFDPDRLAEGGE